MKKSKFSQWVDKQEFRVVKDEAIAEDSFRHAIEILQKMHVDYDTVVGVAVAVKELERHLEPTEESND